MPDFSADADQLDDASAALAISNPALSAALAEDALVLRQAVDELVAQQGYIETLDLFVPTSATTLHTVSVDVTATPTANAARSSPAHATQAVSVGLTATPEVNAAVGVRNTRVLVCVVSAMAVTESPGIIHFTKSITTGDPQWVDRYSYSTGVCPMQPEVLAVGP